MAYTDYFNVNSLMIMLLFLCSCFYLAQGNIALDLSFLNHDIPNKIEEMKSNGYNPYREFNQLVNALFFHFTGLEFLSKMIIKKFGEENGYFVESYVRDLAAGTGVYWITAGLWDIVIYRIKGNQLFLSKGRPIPTVATLLDQMCLAQASLFLYAGLPVFSEYLIEYNMTKTYFYIDQIGGWGPYFAYLILYISFVELGIYWIHRTLHTNKFCYKYIHGLHHKYNKATTLSPWASIAFNPIDGLLQASPYVVGLFFIPVHYFTHVGLLFFSGIWATNIHDTVVSVIILFV